MATAFPGYTTELPESVDGPLRRWYGLLYSWFVFRKPNREELSVTRRVLNELSEYPRLQVSSWPATNIWMPELPQDTLKQTEDLLAQF